MQTIELLKPHTHAGKRLAVGDRLDLNDASARWLIAQGTAKAHPRHRFKPTRRDATSGVSTTAATRRLNMAYFSGQGRVYIGARDESAIQQD